MAKITVVATLTKGARHEDKTIYDHDVEAVKRAVVDAANEIGYLIDIDAVTS